MSAPEDIRTIHARWVATAEPGMPSVLEDQVISFGEDGRIAAIVPRDDFSGKIDMHLPTHIVIPGLVNCHTHTPMTLLRGYADDLPLQEWLFQHVFPTEGKFIMQAKQEEAKEFIRCGSELAVYEMLKTGTTLFNDMYFHGDVTADVVQKAGCKAVLAPMGLLYFGDDMFAATLKTNIDWCTELAKTGVERVYPSLIPHSAYMVPEAKLQEAYQAYKDACSMSGMPFVIHTHMHESEKELADLLEKDWNTAKKSAVQVFDGLGMLSGGRTVCAHCVHMSEEEILLMAARGASIAHNPRSNLKLGSGISPISKMLKAGVNVCLGTDGAASNNTLDMLSEMQYASLLAKGSSRDPTVLPAVDALRMATLWGAKALGLDSETGSLKPGKAADLIAVDLAHLEAAPIFDPLSTLVFTNRREVTHVWVNGRCLVHEGRVLTLKPDLERIEVLVGKIREFRKTLPGRDAAVGSIPMMLCRACGI
mmetsp:Transcript_115157/g.229363  ORF Transcript_115157/g.229363 Transcript_115157/m.229363 type:complete len:478 (+) Transcript_115157:56-1489(+)